MLASDAQDLFVLTEQAFEVAFGHDLFLLMNTTDDNLKF
jgi:hypothetical protein